MPCELIMYDKKQACGHLSRAHLLHKHFAMNKWTFYLETFGCKVNQHESQALREAWQELGGNECFNPEQAEYICINSCAITGKAERDARNAVNRFKKKAPQARIILTGCAAQFFEDFVPRKNANYAKPDVCVEQKFKDSLLAGPWAHSANTKKKNIPCSCTRARPVIKIQDGCTQKCSYCIVPSTRPVLESASPENILAQCRGLLANGFGELMLSGINLRLYGRDKPGYGDFWDLLRYLVLGLEAEFGKIARLRISSLEPAMLTEKALETLASSQMICRHLHLSLQHASTDVLRRMGRGHYTAGSVLAFLENIATFWPVAGIGADIIAGFPGETEDDLSTLLDFIKESPLSYAHVFPYSRRQNTPAQSFPGQIPLKIKNERAALIREEVAKKKRDFWQKLLSMDYMHVAPELEQNCQPNGLIRGVNEYYAPCIISAEHAGQGLVKVMPVEVLENGILVKALT